MLTTLSILTCPPAVDFGLVLFGPGWKTSHVSSNARRLDAKEVGGAHKYIVSALKLKHFLKVSQLMSLFPRKTGELEHVAGTSLGTICHHFTVTLVSLADVFTHF